MFRLLILLVVVGGSLACSTTPDDSLSDRGAADVLEAYLNKTGTETAILVGQVSFGEAVDFQTQAESVKRLPLYRAFAEAGMISFSDERDLTSSFSGWADWLSLTRGARRVAVVTPRPDRPEGVIKKVVRAEPSVSQFGSSLEFLAFDKGEYDVSDVVSNEAYIGGVDKYHVVMAKYTMDVRPTIGAILERSGFPEPHDGRVRVLLKHNPFDETWDAVVLDFDVRGAFSSSDDYSVDRRVRELGLSRR